MAAMSSNGTREKAGTVDFAVNYKALEQKVADFHLVRMCQAVGALLSYIIPVVHLC